MNHRICKHSLRVHPADRGIVRGMKTMLMIALTVAIGLTFGLAIEKAAGAQEKSTLRANFSNNAQAI